MFLILPFLLFLSSFVLPPFLSSLYSPFPPYTSLPVPSLFPLSIPPVFLASLPSLCRLFYLFSFFFLHCLVSPPFFLTVYIPPSFWLPFHCLLSSSFLPFFYIFAPSRNLSFLYRVSSLFSPPLHFLFCPFFQVVISLPFSCILICFLLYYPFCTLYSISLFVPSVLP